MSTKPRVIATLLVRDEQDIVLNCIEHHLRHGVDGFIIMDNLSKDRTPDICKNHPACLAFLRTNDKNHQQSKHTTLMSRLALKFGADWVLNTDADEFYYGLERLGEIPANVNQIKIYKGYHHVITDPVPWGMFSRHMTPYCYGPFKKEENNGKTIFRASDKIRVSHGNHNAYGPWGRKGCVSDREYPFLFFHHYANRSYERWVIKCKNCGSEYRNRAPNKKSHWSRAWTAYKTGKTKEEYQKKIFTPEKLEKALIHGWKHPFGKYEGPLFKFVPDDELPIAELAKRSGFITEDAVAGAPEACPASAEESSR